MKKLIGAVAGMLVMSSAHAVDFHLLSQQCEEALALSALPGALRERANVYVWKQHGFEKTIASDGGFYCLVQRNHPDAIIPECVTESGKDSILQGIMIKTRMAAEGLSTAEIEARAEKMLNNGEIASPSAPGVNYMMSAYNRIYSARTKSIIHVGPHSMFFAPDASNAELGGSLKMAQQTHGFPFVVEEGKHSYIVTFTDKSGETDDVEKHCRGQIDLAVASMGPIEQGAGE